MRTFSLVGAGRLGSALAAGLAGRGWKPVLVVDTDRRALRNVRRLIPGAAVATGYGRLGRDEGLVIISVPDAEVAATAAALARNGADWKGRAVVHTSGLLTSGALGELKRKGAATASLHPAQSFPAPGLPAARFRGVYWTVEGDRPALEAALDVVRALKGLALLVSARSKPLLHLACSLASNGFSSLESAAVSLLVEAGLDEETAQAFIMPLVRGTLMNMTELGVRRSLSGPVARGDAETVRRHLESLKKGPVLKDVYTALGRNALGMVPKGGLPPGRLRALKRLLGRI